MRKTPLELSRESKQRDGEWKGVKVVEEGMEEEEEEEEGEEEEGEERGGRGGDNMGKVEMTGEWKINRMKKWNEEKGWKGERGGRMTKRIGIDQKGKGESEGQSNGRWWKKRGSTYNSNYRRMILL